jgi:hypothetical protein
MLFTEVMTGTALNDVMSTLDLQGIPPLGDVHGLGHFTALDDEASLLLLVQTNFPTRHGAMRDQIRSANTASWPVNQRKILEKILYPSES